MNTSNKISVLLVGCGRMGGALLQGWIKQDICSHVTICDPADLQEQVPKRNFIKTIKNISEASDKYDVCLLATKPQIMDKVCESLRKKTTKDTAILSIAAGKNIAYFEDFLGSDKPIIRSMPNTPAAIGKGITVAVANAACKDAQKSNAHNLLVAGGMVEWINDESLMDAVTAVSGSGPAYIFYLIEILENTGIKLGLSKETSAKLARQTVIGSAALAHEEDGIAPNTLRQNVTSPGGTTEAALKVLMDGRLEKVYEEALIAAKNRGKELSS